MHRSIVAAINRRIVQKPNADGIIYRRDNAISVWDGKLQKAANFRHQKYKKIKRIRYIFSYKFFYRRIKAGGVSDSPVPQRRKRHSFFFFFLEKLLRYFYSYRIQFKENRLTVIKRIQTVMNNIILKLKKKQTKPQIV